jgi:hypothetical protein
VGGLGGWPTAAPIRPKAVVGQLAAWLGHAGGNAGQAAAGWAAEPTGLRGREGVRWAALRSRPRERGEAFYFPLTFY